VGLVRPFDQILWSIAQVVRETEFGEVLRRARLAPNSPTGLVGLKGWTVPEDLHGWELSYDPAIHRTLAAGTALGMLNRTIAPGAADWIQWVGQAHEAVQRIAANCWSGVPPDVRASFLDYDDLLPPATWHYLADLRKSKRGQNALKFAGLDAPRVQAALGRLFAEVRRSESAVSARDAAARLQRLKLVPVLTTVRRRLETEIHTIYKGETGEEGMSRTRRTVDAAYADNPDVAALVEILRRHNRYVTRVMWVLLGAAEEWQPVVVSQTSGPINDATVNGERRLNLTVTAMPFMPFVRLTNPVWLELQSPLDGLYVVEGYTTLLGPYEADLRLGTVG
jgi:hypothetical protein